MADEPQIHSPILELAEQVPGEFAVGSDVALKIKLACPEGCDLGALPLAVLGPDGKEIAGVAAASDAVRALTLKAPDQVGEYTWTVRMLTHERDGVRHEEQTLKVTFKTRPHATSLAVWAVPSPVVMGERFSIKVGAKSSAGQSLAGRAIAISGAGSEVVGRGNLQDTPWPGTSALYWTEVELTAPRIEGMTWYAVNFSATDTETPHEGSASRFSVAVVRRPEHRLAIEVVEKGSRAPIEDAEIRLGAYHAATDLFGRAEVGLPKGSYELTVWKVGYDAPVQTIDISADTGITIEAEVLPEENQDTMWTA